MARPRCQAPGCGRFVGAGADVCDRHRTTPEKPPASALREEIDALRYVLKRLVREVQDLDTLARHVPRVSSVSIQATRTQHQIGQHGQEEIEALIASVLPDLDGPKPTP